MTMEKATFGMKNVGQESENEYIILNACSHDEIVSSDGNLIDRNKQFKKRKLTEMTSEKETKSLKISSALDSYCKTSILNESADFVHSELEDKFKNRSKKSESLLCEICKEDITHLDVYSRGVHVNACIDKQISSISDVKPQTSETENVFILECPLCFKHFSSPELRSNHIKKCGKSKGLSTQSIIKALELQERHALERISLGLPAKPIKPVKPHKNPVVKRVIVEPKNKAESDFQLAKALSLSLTNSSQSGDIQQMSENFTAVILQPPTKDQKPGKKTKNVLTSTPLLVVRTEEERKKLLLDKVATIVTPVSNSEEDHSAPLEIDTSDRKQKENNEEVPVLWNLSNRTSEKADYYVEQLLNWIQPSDVEMGAKLCHLSQIPGHEIVTQLPCEYTFSIPEEEGQTQYHEASSITDPDSPSVIGCLRSLVASSWMSDVDIYTSCGTVIPAHKLILAIRCPSLKEDYDFCSGRDRVHLKWETISFSAALQFLNFIYTGSIEIKDDTLSDLFYLANKYRVYDLQTVLHAKDKVSTHSGNELKEKNPPNANKPSHSPHSSSQVQIMEENRISESQEDTNMNLEIVYNCINSSFKPSQQFCDETNLNDTCSFKCTEICEDNDLSRINYDKFESVTNCSEKTVISNSLSPNHNPTSPIIFDVNDSETSDKEDTELPMNCSQISTSQQSNLIIEELDLYSSESNKSEDSVKFLQSSYVVCNNSIKTPERVESSATSLSPNLSKVVSFSEGSSPIMNNSLQETDNKKCKMTAISHESNELVVDVCNEYESSSSSYLKSLYSNSHSKCEDNLDVIGVKNSSDDNKNTSNLTTLLKESAPATTSLSPDVSTSDLRKYELTTLPYESNGIVHANAECMSPVSSYSKMQHSDFQTEYASNTLDLNNVKLKDASNENCEVFLDNKNMLNEVTSLNINEDVRIKNSFVSAESYKDCIHEFSFSNSFSKLNEFAENTSLRRTASPEVLICDSDSDSKSQINNLCETDPLCNYNMNLTTKENKSTFSKNSPPKTFNSSFQKSPMPLSDPDNFAYEPYDDYFDYEISSPNKSEILHSHSSKNILHTEEQHRAEKVSVTPSTHPESAHNQYQLSDSPVTPLPDYKNMMTPQIREALKKIGVRALPRKKAVAVLSHVYNETHPLMDGEGNTVSCSQTSVQKISKENKVTKLKKRKNDNIKELTEKRQKRNQSKESTSQDSDDSSTENPDWLGCVPEISFSQSNENSPTKPNKDDAESVKNYIQSNEELYYKILSYMPLNLVELHQEMKSNNIKISIQKLMDFLDEQCITFTCPRKEEYQKKQTARCQRFRKNMIAKLSQQAS